MRRNLLITSSGSKVLLTRAFLQAAKSWDCKVFTADVNNNCATSLISQKHFQLARTSSEGAEDKFFEILKKNDIGLVVPTRDGELPFMASLASQALNEGTRVLVCSQEALKLCQNKRTFTEAVNAMGYKASPIVSPNDEAIKYPLFMRPVIGSAGRGTRKVSSPDDLPEREAWNDILFHPFIDAPEFSIDLLMDLEPGIAIQCVVRERIEVVSGEAKVSKVVSNPKLEEQTLELGRKLGLVGHNVVQAFVMPNNEITFIEVNPRFGGASNLSIQAGLRSAERIVALHQGIDRQDNIKKFPIKLGATMYRYSEDFIKY